MQHLQRSEALWFEQMFYARLNSIAQQSTVTYKMAKQISKFRHRNSDPLVRKKGPGGTHAMHVMDEQQINKMIEEMQRINKMEQDAFFKQNSRQLKHYLKTLQQQAETIYSHQAPTTAPKQRTSLHNKLPTFSSWSSDFPEAWAPV